MDALKLRFSAPDQPELALGAGVHGVGRLPGGGDVLGFLEESQSPQVHFCVDRRGVWLTVSERTLGVHVNGRQVLRMAMLRVGDAVYVDGIEMRLVSESPPAVPSAALRNTLADTNGDPRTVLRGVGGQYHGRSFTLQQPRLVGRATDADIRIDDPAFADRHARLELIDDRVVLRDLGSSEGTLVNGEAMRDALLNAGDQIVFDAHHRFVVESPAPSRASEAAKRGNGDAHAFDFNASDVSEQHRSPAWRLPWVLVAALFIAALLLALLLFGSG